MYRYIITNPADLIDAENNSRTHSDQQIQQVVESIQEWGFTNPLLIDENNRLVAGHGRKAAAMRLGLTEVPCIVLEGLTDMQKKAYVIADNQLALNAGWDFDLLKQELLDLDNVDFDLGLIGFDASFLDGLMVDETPGEEPDPITATEPVVDPISVEGDIWVLGKQKVMCGDSTSVDHVTSLMGGETASLLHADPPYGMGKEGDGVANDNLYNEKLDDFQMEWWATFRTFIVDNASVYIWGNAPDLWRLWYHRLESTELFTLRNQIVWDKKSIPGMKSDLMTQYPIASEHCLFIQIGKQFLGNINAEDYPEEYEVVRGYLEKEANAAGIRPKDIKEVCGCSMYSHWFTKSQFTLIPAKHYMTLQTVYQGQFLKPWSELKAEWDNIKGSGRGVINQKLKSMRSYFDNAHDVMRDVWEFPRVVGDERHDHATPKPVDMMIRVMKSSLPPGGLCIEPFGGSGSTLMGAEKSGRRCYTMELQPMYVDTIVKRWQTFTGLDAVNQETGQTYNEMKLEQENG